MGSGEVLVREVGELLGVEGLRAAEGGERQREFRVVLIREGLAKSGRYFTRRAVEQIAAAAEGLRAFADHPTPTEDRERPARSVRDVVGFYRDGRVAEEDGRIRAEATLRVFESAEWLAQMAREALNCGYPEVIGLSIDSMVKKRTGRPEGMEKEVVIVEELAELRSVDVVTRPSAGGKFLAVKEGEEMTAEQVELETGEEGGGGMESQAAEQVETERTERTEQMGMKQGEVVQMKKEPAAEATGVLAEARRVLSEVQETQFRNAAGRVLEEHLAAAEKLPESAKAKLRRHLEPDGSRYAGVEAYGQIVEAAVREEADVVKDVRDSAREELEAGRRGTTLLGAAGAGGSGSGRVRSYWPVHVVGEETDKQRLVAQIAMDRLLGYEGGEDDAEWRRARELGLLPGMPKWGGIREAYVQLTGDAAISGIMNPELSMAREANEVTSGVLNHALLNSMTKKLVRDYRGQPREWTKFCAVTPLQNFKSQDRVRLHDFSSLSTVAEGAAYTNLVDGHSRIAA